MKSPAKLYLLLSRKAQVAVNNPKLLSKKSDADKEAARRNERSHLGADDWRVETYSRDAAPEPAPEPEPEDSDDESLDSSG